MKPILEKVPDHANGSFAVKRDIIPHIDMPWHYHPEHQLIYVKKGYGTRLVGSHIGNFYDGDMALIGSNLPHVWKNDDDFYKKDSSKMADLYVVHFLIEKIAASLFPLPEMERINRLLIKSNKGLLITGKTHAIVAEKIETLAISQLVDIDLRITDADSEQLDFPGTQVIITFKTVADEEA